MFEIGGGECDADSLQDIATTRPVSHLFTV